MMGIVVPETCWAYNKYNKISSGIYLAFWFFRSRMFSMRLELKFSYHLDELQASKESGLHLRRATNIQGTVSHFLWYCWPFFHRF